MSAHTPGPWQAIFDHPQNACANVQAGFEEIATIWGHDSNQGSSGVWIADARRDANARLIAAAPDLYEALCALVLNIEAGGATLGAIYDARAAIAKARGES